MIGKPFKTCLILKFAVDIVASASRLIVRVKNGDLLPSKEVQVLDHSTSRSDKNFSESFKLIELSSYCVTLGTDLANVGNRDLSLKSAQVAA
jgi:hypothetical protein